MRLKKIALTMAVILLSGAVFGGCQASKTIKVPKAELATPMDQTIPLLTGDNSAGLLSNIDRGFRTETYYTLGSGCSYPGTADDGYEYLNTMLARFKEENPREIQAYVYLTEYYNKPLDQKALDQLKAYLETMREKRLGVLLRFAYDPDQPYDKSPTEEQLLAHIAQLKAWMEENKDLVNGTVTVLQMGMVGAWGEWGGSQQKYDRKKIALAICGMPPEGTYLQARYTNVVSLTKKAPNADKVGYHNDFLVARPHPWNTAGDKNYTPSYKTFAKNAPYRMNDGEMPWVGATQEPNEYVDGKKFIQQAYEHHFATLSIEHNYKEVQKKAPSPSAFNIARWKTEAVTAQDLKTLGVPYYDSWFVDKNGDAVTRTIYEYLRDFLGYQLILSNLSTAAGQNGGNTVAFLLTNVGLGAPLTLDRMELVVKDKGTGKESRYPIKDFDPLKLTTYGQQAFTLTIKETPENCTLGVAILRERNKDGDYTIRTANNIPFENGVNIIKS